MRNPKVHRELVERVFDAEDKTLGLNIDERLKFILAFLGNLEALEDNRKEMKRHFFHDTFDAWDAWALHDTEKHYATLWKHISKWPKTLPGKEACAPPPRGTAVTIHDRPLAAGRAP
jgi:hypothetical protein